MGMLYQIIHHFGWNVWDGFWGNYKVVLGMMAIAMALHLIPDDAADKFLNRYSKIPMAVYISLFFLFVLLYGFFKSAEPVLPIYLQF